MRQLVGLYESWARQLLPTVPFPDFVKQLEKMPKNINRAVYTYRILDIIKQVIETNNGFEAWRIINHHYDPRRPGDELMLDKQILDMTRKEASNPKGIPGRIA